MLNKVFRNLALLLAILGISTLEAEAQSTVYFGSLYGEGYGIVPDLETVILDANNDPVGESLIGTPLWFLCLDQFSPDPSSHESYIYDYHLGTSHDILTTGVWQGITNTATRSTIMMGISNMFGNNQDLIYSQGLIGESTNTFPGSIVQVAAWAMIHEYGTGWSGIWDEDALSSLVSYLGSLDGNTYYSVNKADIIDYLSTSLTYNADMEGRVIFGQAAETFGGEYFQAAMFITPVPIPEPSSALMVFGASILWLGRRKRGFSL